MKMAELSRASVDYERIEKAIIFLNQNFRRQPSLQEVARSAHMSEFHFQRLFSRWVGISPKKYLQVLTKEHAKHLLRASRSVLDTSYESGLSGPGRLHDLFVTCEAYTPGEYKARGAGLAIAFGFVPSPFGQCLLGLTSRGVCWLSFVSHLSREEALSELVRQWPQARFHEDQAAVAKVLPQIFTGRPTEKTPGIQLHLLGTNFQIKVWEALLRIEPGQVVTYESLACALGKPRASRAVGLAVGRNPVSYLVPCHRVIRKMGTLGGYRWGLNRKQAMLAWESGRFGAPANS